MWKRLEEVAPNHRVLPPPNTSQRAVNRAQRSEVEHGGGDGVQVPQRTNPGSHHSPSNAICRPKLKCVQTLDVVFSVVDVYTRERQNDPNTCLRNRSSGTRCSLKVKFDRTTPDIEVDSDFHSVRN
ncbi:unnamed protein product [Pleuronectes platessa]|uniref:Uncharacterized protein n=1 Tax=Pleuronectes platessa TaxID=8262 RepID=A0A9N7UV04_PLEPL|nr:unnamed protein product [Pleuronectes platessa]